MQSELCSTSSIELESCVIGKAKSLKCHVLFYTKKTGLKSFREFSTDDQKLLSWRAEVDVKADETICLHHVAMFLDKFESRQKACCNPFNKTQHRVITGLRTVDIHVAENLNKVRVYHYFIDVFYVI